MFSTGGEGVRLGGGGAGGDASPQRQRRHRFGVPTEQSVVPAAGKTCEPQRPSQKGALLAGWPPPSFVIWLM